MDKKKDFFDKIKAIGSEFDRINTAVSGSREMLRNAAFTAVPIDVDYKREQLRLLEEIKQSLKSSTIIGGYMGKEYDVFISHATGDKTTFVNKLYSELLKVTTRVFYDTAIITWGDNLTAVIDAGLEKCEFGIVILSKIFFGRPWCEKELKALCDRQKSEGQKILLPIIHGCNFDEIKVKYPFLEDTLMLDTSKHNAKEISQLFSAELIKRLRSNDTIMPEQKSNSIARQNFGLFVKARWSGNVPYEIVQTKGFDEFNVLTPTEPDYQRPLQTVQIDETEKADTERHIYFFIESNSTSIIYDFKIVRIEVDVETKIRKEPPPIKTEPGVVMAIQTSAVEYEYKKISKSFQKDIPIVASIKKVYSFALQIPAVKIGTGKMVVDFGFSCDNQNYVQSFEFEINEKCLQCTSGNYFIQRKYSDPKILPKKFTMEDF